MRFRLATLFLFVAASAFSVAAQPAKMEPVPLVLPKPLFRGTPEVSGVSNLEKALGKPRPPFLAPAGTTNVALHKPVTSSDSTPTAGSLDMITDGDNSGVDGSFVVLKSGEQTVTIDLEAPHTLYAIVLWHYLKEPRCYKNVVVQVADDPDFLTNVRTLFNNDSENTGGFGIGMDRRYVETAEGKLIDAKGVTARYVRLASGGSDRTGWGSHDNDENNYVEVEVFGKP